MAPGPLAPTPTTTPRPAIPSAAPAPPSSAGPLRMTRVAARCVINEILDTAVLLRNLRLVAVLVTGNAGKDRVIRAIRMAVAALRPLTLVRAAVDRKVRGIVSFVLRAGPIRKRVARVAGLRESGRRVIGIGRVVVIRLMAAPAVAGCGCVVVPHVTQAALVIGQHRGVIAGQLERRRRMRKRGARPVGSRVAQRAILREARGRMARIVGSVVIGLMAVPARWAVQRVVIVHMTLAALQTGVKSGQGKPCRRMVERRPQPVRRRVAPRTILRETLRGVWRVVGSVVI